MVMTTELLLPAGDFEKLKFAFAFGADAVYAGIPRFSLRARENGFTKESLIEAVHYTQSIGKKIYVTANVIPHNHKVDPFVQYVGRFLEKCQPDAWIMSDPGMIMLMQEHYPNQEIHLSVQANTVNYASAKFWEKLGVTRIILSRELSIKEIKTIKEACPNLEIEAFVHGSICIAYSGRCLISNYMSYRDPNQGTCTNSCRWEFKIHEKGEAQSSDLIQIDRNSESLKTQHEDDYKLLKGDYYLEETDRPGEFMQLDEDENGTYLMNARDLCGIEYLKELKEAGVVSFKVEGRSKSVYYAASIARAYRKAIDDLNNGKPFNPQHLEDVFSTSNRGFTPGFLMGNPGKNAQKYDNNIADKISHQFSGVIRGYDEENKMIKVEPKNPIRPGLELQLLLPSETVKFTVEKIINDKDGKEMEAIHGGPRYCWIPFPYNPGEFALLREQVSEFVTEEVLLSRK